MINWFSIDEIANLVDDKRENIIQFIIEDRIPYVVLPEGIYIPLGGFQMCMPDLYPLAEWLDEIERKINSDV